MLELLFKGIDRKDSDRNDVVRMLIRAGASPSTWQILIFEKPTRLQESYWWTHSECGPSKQKKKKDIPSLHPIKPYSDVFWVSSTEQLLQCKHGPTRKKSSTLVVPDVVYQPRHLPWPTSHTRSVSYSWWYGYCEAFEEFERIFEREARISLLFRLLRVLTVSLTQLMTHNTTRILFSNINTEHQRSNTGTTHRTRYVWNRTWGNEDSIPKDKLADRCMTVATLLKCFFRELRKPLITVDVMSIFRIL